MAHIMPASQLEAHDYVNGEKMVLSVGSKPASEFAVGEKWTYEYETETARIITSQICVKQARKYVYFAHRLQDATHARDITKVLKTRMLTYSLEE